MDVEQGHTPGGLPYLRFGTGSRRIVGIAPLTPANTPTGGLGVAASIDRFRFLGRDHTVDVVNRRPGLHPGATIGHMAADYAAMIETELTPPVDVVGVSTGGTVALQLAADRPDLLRRLVIYSSAHRLGDAAKPLMLRIAERARERRWGTAAGEVAAFLWLPKDRLGRVVTRPIRWLASAIGWIALRHLDPSDLVITIEAEDAFDIGPRLGEIRVPTMVVAGGRDPAYPPALVRATAAGIPGARLLLYPDKGHAPAGRAVTEAILAFLNEAALPAACQQSTQDTTNDGQPRRTAPVRRSCASTLGSPAGGVEGE
jgi:pimeloyl-ACP methyl ester carboxylesterase